MVDKTTSGETAGPTPLKTDIVRAIRLGTPNENFRWAWADILPLIYTDATLKAELIAVVRGGFSFPIPVPISGPVDPVVAGVSLAYFDCIMPFTLTGAAGSLLVASTTGNVILDLNENGNTVLANKVTIIAGALNSLSAPTQPTVINGSNVFEAGSRLTWDVDNAGSSADAVYAIGYVIGHFNAS